MAMVVTHRINICIFLNAHLLLLVMLPLTPSSALAEDTKFAADEVFLAVHINQQPQGTIFLLRSDDRLLVGARDLRRLRFRLPVTVTHTLDGEDFYALDALAGLSYKVDESSQALTLEAPPSLFDATLLKGSVNNFSTPAPASPGGFFNYDMSSYHGQGQTTTSGVLELGGFAGWGAGQTRILARDLGGQANTIRLDTTWTRDRPLEIASLRVGDAISGTSSWGGGSAFWRRAVGNQFLHPAWFHCFPAARGVWRSGAALHSGPLC
ncbi:hypothetical protein OAI46_00680 [Alphaproteobacteria bacterium]|nr:hypothetical protein [Alphaproteobacteria bacterium]